MIGSFSLGALVIATVAVFGGVVLRSITGFGGSLVIAVGLTTVLTPAEAVPVVLLVDLPIGLAMLNTTWGQAPKTTTAPAIWAMLATTPIGVAALAALPANPMRIAIGAIVVASTVALAVLPPPSRAPRPALFGFAGAIGGFLNGATSAGGPPLILAHYGTGAEQTARRASLSITFVATDFVAIAAMWIAGLVDGPALQRAAVLAPIAIAAPLLVDKPLSTLSDKTVRPIALAALFAIGAAGLLNGFSH